MQLLLENVMTSCHFYFTTNALIIFQLSMIPKSAGTLRKYGIHACRH